MKNVYLLTDITTESTFFSWLTQGVLDFLVSQAVDDGVQQRGHNTEKYRNKDIHI